MNRKGYLLIEVVLIISIITSFLLVIPNLKKTSCDVTIKYFSKILSNDIEYALGYTMTNFTLINIDILPQQNSYVLRNGNLQRIITRNYDKSLIINNIQVKISHGYVLNNYTLNIKCYKFNYQILIMEKSGNINVIKE